jgi:creatinine amidohydrolase
MNTERRYELLTPVALSLLLHEAPVAYVPVGSLEWHGRHLPVGLDAVKVHRLCLAAAQRTGGVVLPAFFYGTGGGHRHYCWTIMTDTAGALGDLLTLTVARLSEFGFRVMVLITGHYPGDQTDMVQVVAARHHRSGIPGVVLPLSDMQLGLGLLERDHAALYETSIMQALDASLVHLENLPTLAQIPLDTSAGWSDGRHAPEHPLYGIFGQDPRSCDNQTCRQLLQRILDDLTQRVQVALESQCQHSPDTAD